jgi:prevent-host-death family protein
MSHMEAIGVRELRRDASRWLARVRAGESFVVTDRGRPIARLAPLGDPVGYEAMMADGRIAPGSGRTVIEVLADLDATLPADDGPSVSEALASLRDAER